MSVRRKNQVHGAALEVPAKMQPQLAQQAHPGIEAPGCDFTRWSLPAECQQ